MEEKVICDFCGCGYELNGGTRLLKSLIADTYICEDCMKVFSRALRINDHDIFTDVEDIVDKMHDDINFVKCMPLIKPSKMKEYFNQYIIKLKEQFRELEKELRLLEKNGKIDLEQPFDLRRNSNVYEALKRIETIQLRRLTDYYWMGAQVIKESMTRSYLNTTVKTFEMFNYTKGNDQYYMTTNPKLEPLVQVRDTHIYEHAVKVPWCQDGKTYSDRLYGHVANFQSKL